MFTIIITAALSSIFTALLFLLLFQRVVQPYMTNQLAHIKREAELTITLASPQISQDIADAIEAKIATLQPELEQQLRQELELMLEEFLPQLSQEIEQGMDNSFRKFIPTLVGSAAIMPAETLLKTSSSLLNTGFGILRGVTGDNSSRK